MRVGILTFHAAYNYGAVLQCYALQTYIESLGHDVNVIDYRLKPLLRVYKTFDIRRFLSSNPLRCWRKCLRETRLLPWRWRRRDAFEAFIGSRLHLASMDSIAETPYDVIIVGSDQVWNTALTDGYDPYYWASFEHPDGTSVVAYAASMEGDPSADKRAQLSRRLRGFSRISVREASLAALLGENHVAAVDVVDPTLLLPASHWSALAGERLVTDDYLFLYEVNPHPQAEEIALQIARQLRLRVVTLAALLEANTTPLAFTASPQTFLSLARHAAFVVASSFHGTVFALQFRRPFVSVRSASGLDSRVANLLAQVGLQDRFVADADSERIAKWAAPLPAVSLDTDARRRSVAFLHEVLTDNNNEHESSLHT